MLGRTVTTNLLTGFLGSGKTSLLKRLLTRPGLEHTAVLINEFGEVGLDHLLLEKLDEDVVLLSSGCLCCQIRGDLKDAMVRLFGQAQKGLVPAFDRLVIETTGLADPAPIVATLGTDPVLRNHFRLGNIVTVIDALAGAANLERFEEARKQVAVADRLIVSKADLDAGAAHALAARLAILNPTAQIELGDEEGTPEAALVTRDIHDDHARMAAVERWLAAPQGDATGHAHPHDAIRSIVLRASAPLDWARFGLWLSMLLNRHGQHVLRLKGMLEIGDSDRPVVIHGVQHTIHKPLHLDAWPNGVARTAIVVITDGLDPAMIERSFREIVLACGNGDQSLGADRGEAIEAS